MNKKDQQRYQSLYNKHISALKRQGKSKGTTDCYARSVRQITEHFDTCPDKLTLEQLEDYFLYLVDNYSWSTVTIHRNGLQFFYKHTLKKEWDWVNIVKPSKRTTLPVILTPGEITKLIASTKEPRYAAYLYVTYSMGLRLSESLNLKVCDIDSDRMRIHVRQSKNLKDRYVILPQSTLMVLRRYWVQHRNPSLIFPSGRTVKERQQSNHPMAKSPLQEAFKAIVKSGKIYKNVSIHSLRHSYAVHLMESGVHLRSIQELLGHSCPKTTARYTQLTKTVHQDTEGLINQAIGGIYGQLRLEVNQ